MKKLLYLFAIFTITSLIFSCASTKNISEDLEPGNSQQSTTQIIETSTLEQESPQEIPQAPVPKYTLRAVEGAPVYFTETWGYVSQRRIEEYDPSMPITDVCFFAASVSSNGDLTDVPKRSKLNTGRNRCHLVIVCDSRALTHFVVSPNYDVRRRLLNQIVAASSPYDGVQLDFECINYEDSRNYISFVADLRYKLKGKMLSVCVPARFKLLTQDVYPYAKIANYCDRVFVMAYDQHWSTSAPGAIAEVDWCKQILSYSQQEIIPRKLIMGVPFYGRTWGNETTNSAWYFSGINRIMTEHGVESVEYENDIPTFEYSTTVKVKGYFNDAWSTVNLCRIYEQAGVRNIGFWRIGQEDPAFWDYLKTQKK